MRTDEEQLLTKTCIGLDEGLDHEKRMLNEFEKQTQKIQAFWTMDKQKLNTLKMELRNKFRLKQDLEERQQYELKVYQEKVKHLLFEQQANVTDVRTEAEVALKSMEDTHRDEQHQFRMDCRALLVAQKEMSTKHQELLNQHKREQEEAIMKLRLEYQRKSEDLRLDYEERMRVVRAKAQTRRRTEIREIETVKGKHIASLMQKHKEAFADIKNYYNDITHANLDLIKSLKAEVQDTKAKEKGKEQAMIDVAQVNRQLSEPFKKHLRDVEKLKVLLQAYQKDKEQLSSTKSQIGELEKKYHRLQWEHEILIQKKGKLSTEHDMLQDKLEETINSNAQRQGFKNLLLERKILALRDALERKESALHEVLASMKDQGPAVSRKLEDVLASKNETLKTLEAELGRLTQKYYNTVHYYETVMKVHEVPLTELGFYPAIV